MDLNVLIKDTQLGIKLRQLKHRLTYRNVSNAMACAMKRYEECENKKPASQIRHEINLCKKYWDCYPLHYYRYDLFKQDKVLSNTELINYIPDFFFYNLFLPYYDSNKYEILLEDKNITEQLFKSLNIAQPKTIIKLINNHVFTGELMETSLSDVKSDLLGSKCEKIFLKPVDGKGGYGIRVFHRDESGEYITKNEEKFDRKFLSTIADKDYIAQEAIKQQGYLNDIYPDSVNTFRIATENLKGNIRIVCAVLRIGRGGKEVDNASQGGMLLKIDISTGKTGNYAITEMGETFDKHPDTDFVFQDFNLAHWDQIERFVIESARKLPNFTYLGWDIADSVEGPIAIEANLGFGLDLYQVTLGGLKEVFKIDDPRIYYKKKRIGA